MHDKRLWLSLMVAALFLLPAALLTLAQGSLDEFLYLPVVQKPAAPTATPTLQPTPTSSPTPSPTATQPPNPSQCIPPPALCSCSGNLYNCSDFTYQCEAQLCYDHCLAQTGGDIHRLDRDNDGIACETLPDLSDDGDLFRALPQLQWDQ